MAKGRYYQQGSGGDILRWARGKIEAIENVSADVLEEAGEKGEALMKHNIATRGTAKSGKEGRIESGDMLKDVKHYTAKRTDGRTQMGFGWTGQRKPYYGYQETGFQHFGGVTVPGMYALADAADEVLTDLGNDLRKALRAV